MDDAFYIAVLGDLHGHFTLAYRVLKRWEREEGRALDLILQVGDLGAFPPPFRLDKATKRFAERDPDELGFAAYYAGEPEAEEILGDDAPPERRVSADFVFIRGNHEDFEFLEERASRDGPSPVDAFGKIFYLASGVKHTLERGALSLSIAGLGGISEDGEPADEPASAFYTREEVRRLRNLGPVDILLSHEPPRGAAEAISPRYALAGSPEVAALIRELAPRYHFCGHYHEPGQALYAPDGTESYELHAVNFHKPHRLNPGCIGILRWAGRGDSSFALLDAPWLREYTRASFRYL
jgi:hypothetical protein